MKVRALRLDEATGLDGVSYGLIELDGPKAGEVLVRLKAAALNHRELWITRGLYPGMMLPSTLGADGAGIIEAVGEGVDRARIGEAVVLYPGLNWGEDQRFPGAAFGLLGMPGPGTIAEAICVSATSAVRMPGHLSFEQAASVPLAGLTAWRGLMTKASLIPQDKVLVTGAGGGVATLALKFALALGCRTFVTSGSEETLTWARELGASEAINYNQDGWEKSLPRAPHGIDVVLDGAPAAGLLRYSRALNMGARIVVYGSTGGLKFEASATDLFLKNAAIIGTNVGNLSEFLAMLAFMEAHRIEPAIDRNFAFEDAKVALTHLERSHGFGKVTIRIADAP